MGFGLSRDVTCLVCNEPFMHAKHLSTHLKKVHGFSSEEYTIKLMLDGIAPACPTCGTKPRFVKLGEFKKYCKDHSHEAAVAGGKKGGRAPAWNRGLTAVDDPRIAAAAVKMSGIGNPFFGKKHSELSKLANADKHRLPADEVMRRIERIGKAAVLTDISSCYVGQNVPLDVVCMTCRTPDSVSLFNFERCWRCKTCEPLGSKQQLEILEFVESLGFADVESSTRRVISPLEIDVWVPSMKVGIEHHGLYWHSGGRSPEPVDKTRHRRKLDACRAAGVRLIQLYSDEWEDRPETCKSVIRNALGKNQRKLNGRDCQVIFVDSSVTRPFLEAAHMSGATRAKAHFALIHFEHGLVGAVTVRIPIQKKWGENLCELARMAFAFDTTVRGGASKLLAAVEAWAKSEGYAGILSYAELRFGEGGVYQQCGFTRMGETGLSYCYTDGTRRYDRFKYRAQPGKPEKQVVEEANVRAVWGCGNAVYVKKW